jgi:hypothetical protein
MSKKSSNFEPEKRIIAYIYIYYIVNFSINLKKNRL